MGWHHQWYTEIHEAQTFLWHQMRTSASRQVVASWILALHLLQKCKHWLVPRNFEDHLSRWSSQFICGSQHKIRQASEILCSTYIRLHVRLIVFETDNNWTTSIPRSTSDWHVNYHTLHRLDSAWGFQELWDFIQRCWAHDPRDRVSANLIRSRLQSICGSQGSILP